MRRKKTHVVYGWWRVVGGKRGVLRHNWAVKKHPVLLRTRDAVIETLNEIIAVRSFCFCPTTSHTPYATSILSLPG